MQIKSIQQYIDLIEELQKRYIWERPSPTKMIDLGTKRNPHFIYRGHSNQSYALIPGIFRMRKCQSGEYRSEFSQDEQRILTNFISESYKYIHDVDTDDLLSWLEIAQHFGVPTRLLDFTENPLVALYFACASNPDKDAEVCIVNEPAFNKVFYEDQSELVTSLGARIIVEKIINDEIRIQTDCPHDDDKRYFQYPFIYKPYYKQERMNMQASVFMLWAGKHEKLTSFFKPEHYMKNIEDVNNQDVGALYLVQIASNDKKAILQQLDMCGINEKFIYPGVDGVGRFIRKKYTNPNIS